MIRPFFLADLSDIATTNIRSTVDRRYEIGGARGGAFLWDVDSSATIDNGVVFDGFNSIGRLIRQYDGDTVKLSWWDLSQANDQPSLQAASDYIKGQGGGTLVFPKNATIVIDSVVTFSAMSNFTIEGNHSTIQSSPTAPISSAGATLRTYESNNFAINNLVLDGNKDNRGVITEVTGHTWDMRGCVNVRANNVKMLNSISDGIILEATTNGDANTFSRDVVFHGCVFDAAWRNGVAVVHARDVTFDSCRILNTNGSRASGGAGPEVGMDIEPDSGSAAVGATRNIYLKNCLFSNNGYGQLWVPTSAYRVDGVFIENCTFEINGPHPNTASPGVSVIFSNARAVMTKCRFKGENSDIVIDSGSDVEIDGQKFDDVTDIQSTASGLIHVLDAASANIHDCEFKSVTASKACVFIHSTAPEVFVTNNRFEAVGIAFDGIAGAKNVKFEGNTLIDPGGVTGIIRADVPGSYSRNTCINTLGDQVLVNWIESNAGSGQHFVIEGNELRGHDPTNNLTFGAISLSGASTFVVKDNRIVADTDVASARAIRGLSSAVIYSENNEFTNYANAGTALFSGTIRTGRRAIITVAAAAIPISGLSYVELNFTGSVTSFTGGSDGQPFAVGGSGATLSHGGSISLASGADHVLAAGDLFMFRMDNGVAREVTTTATGGAGGGSTEPDEIVRYSGAAKTVYALGGTESTARAAWEQMLTDVADGDRVSLPRARRFVINDATWDNSNCIVDMNECEFVSNTPTATDFLLTVSGNANTFQNLVLNQEASTYTSAVLVASALKVSGDNNTFVNSNLKSNDDTGNDQRSILLTSASENTTFYGVKATGGIRDDGKSCLFCGFDVYRIGENKGYSNNTQLTNGRYRFINGTMRWTIENADNVDSGGFQFNPGGTFGLGDRIDLVHIENVHFHRPGQRVSAVSDTNFIKAHSIKTLNLIGCSTHSPDTTADGVHIRFFFSGTDLSNPVDVVNVISCNLDCGFSAQPSSPWTQFNLIDSVVDLTNQLNDTTALHGQIGDSITVRNTDFRLKTNDKVFYVRNTAGNQPWITIENVVLYGTTVDMFWGHSSNAFVLGRIRWSNVTFDDGGSEWHSNANIRAALANKVPGTFDKYQYNTQPPEASTWSGSFPSVFWHTSGTPYPTTINSVPNDPEYQYDGAAWQTLSGGGGGLNNIVEDATPQLGGDLDGNAFDVLFDTSTGIRDENNNEQLIFTTTASAVNHIGITNAAAGNDPTIAAIGDDANIDLNLVPKGSGVVQAGGVEIVTTTGAQALSNKTTIDLSHTAPAVRLNDSDATADERRWHLTADGGQLRLRAFNDAQTLSSDVFVVSRSSMSVTTATTEASWKYPDGDVTNPGIGFFNDIDTGLFLNGTAIHYTKGGVDQGELNTGSARADGEDDLGNVSGAVSIDLAGGTSNNKRVTVTGDVTSWAFTNLANGLYTLKILQSAGPHDLDTFVGVIDGVQPYLNNSQTQNVLRFSVHGSNICFLL